MSTARRHEIGFVGAGRMAGAMVRGLLERAGFEPGQLVCTCGEDNTGPDLAAATGITFDPDLASCVASADTIVLACKPQQFASLPSLADEAAGKLILSILAGTPLARLAEHFGTARCVVRTMPNTPGQVGAGITGWSPASEPNAADRERIATVLGALGMEERVDEDLLDAITAVSGSGPAYLFEFTAALAEAATACGLSAELAARFARQTVIGSARLLEADPASPDELRNRVTSPGGTTEAALEVLANGAFRELLTQAVLRARDRSRELR